VGAYGGQVLVGVPPGQQGLTLFDALGVLGGTDSVYALVDLTCDGSCGLGPGTCLRDQYGHGELRVIGRGVGSKPRGDLAPFDVGATGLARHRYLILWKPIESTTAGTGLGHFLQRVLQ